MRTGQKLFKSLSSPNEAAKALPPRKGRNGQLMAQRNELLLRRFFYYITYTPLRREVVITEMQKEFYLTERHLWLVIYSDEAVAELRRLKEEPLTLAELRKAYPHLLWTKQGDA